MPSKIVEWNRWALDCDGVLFDFNTAFCERIAKEFDVHLPAVTKDWPTKWDYPDDYLPSSQLSSLWKKICAKDSYTFWRELPVYGWSKPFLAEAQEGRDLIFVTSRCGSECKRATEDALRALGVEDPKVAVASYKPPHLDCVDDFLDDKPQNFTEAHEVWGSSLRYWILDQPWNRDYNPRWIRRIYDPREMLD